MTREEKEKFICEVWAKMQSPKDKISHTALSKLSEQQIDTMAELYKRLYGNL